MAELDLEALKRLQLLRYRWATVDTKGYAVLSQWATFARDASGALFGFVSGAGWPEMAHQLSNELTLLLGQLPALIAALERIPELERERDGWRAEMGRMKGLHRQALAERDDEIERLNAGLETFRQRAERMEAAARDVCEVFVDRGAPGSVIDRLRAALAAAPAEEGPDGTSDPLTAMGTPNQWPAEEGDGGR